MTDARKTFLFWLKVCGIIAFFVMAVIIPNVKTAKEYCSENPNDSSKCFCEVSMLEHVVFTNTFNDTTPGLIQMLFNHTNPYGESNMSIQMRGNNDSGLMILGNFSQDYSVYFQYVRVRASCAQAIPLKNKVKQCLQKCENAASSCGSKFQSNSTKCQDELDTCDLKC